MRLRPWKPEGDYEHVLSRRTSAHFPMRAIPRGWSYKPAVGIFPASLHEAKAGMPSEKNASISRLDSSVRFLRFLRDSARVMTTAVICASCFGAWVRELSQGAVGAMSTCS